MNTIFSTLTKAEVMGKKEKEFIPALGYNVLSRFYDVAIKLTMPEKKFRKKLVDLLAPKIDEEILEFGFGTGQNIVMLKKENKALKIQGVDIDPKIKSIADFKLKKHKIDTPLFLYDGSTLPFENNSFDKIYSCLVFHQLDAETKLSCLQELNRILKPNGQLIIADWGKAKSRWRRFLFYAVQLLDGFKTTTDNVNGLMPDFIQGAGFFDVVEVDFINTRLGTFSYYKSIKKNEHE